ncbi:aldehyde dehydrogenase family protein [Streptomyces sp. ISL-11]|nr:aldehyde dehydrogenase family protein [Streptomyces sp. ISL-11]
MVALDALGPTGPFRARRRVTVEEVTGRPAAELSLVPELFVSRALAALRRAEEMPVDDRVAALARAGQAFATATVAGLPPAAYQHLVSRVSGLPLSVVRRAADTIARAAADAHRAVRQARPHSAVDHWRDPATRAGCAVWCRRGEVFAVLAAGNHPAVHAQWLQALALGFRVAVRPSQREPLTAHRLITALREAGFGPDHVVLLPTDHHTADRILTHADLATVYGSTETLRAYAGNPLVLPQGPGRSKILITADTDWTPWIDTLVASVGHEAGTACVNATAVLVEGDPTPVAQALAEHLAALPVLPPHDERAVLPAQPLATAHALNKHLLDHAAGATTWLGKDGVLADLGDGSAVLRPAVHQLDHPGDERAGLEMPFPCVWVTPWTREAGLTPLRHTLALTALTQDETLIDALVGEPTISGVHIGPHPTHLSTPAMPHDAFLAEFLMRTKAVIR